MALFICAEEGTLDRERRELGAEYDVKVGRSTRMAARFYSIDTNRALLFRYLLIKQESNNANGSGRGGLTQVKGALKLTS
jgi:hypothetical protein